MGEIQPRSKETSCLLSVLITSLPAMPTSIELALVIDHEHDFPLKDVVVGQAAGDSGNVLIALHLFKLTSQKPGSGALGHGEVLLTRCGGRGFR